MAIPEPRLTPPRPAESEAAWPALAALLAPAAGCDCQMLAVKIAEKLDARATIEPRIAER